MNNKFFVMVFVFIVIVILGIVLFDSDEISPLVQDAGIAQLQDTNKLKQENIIEYTQTSEKLEKKAPKDIYHKEKEIILDKSIKYKTSDSSGRYGLEIIDGTESDTGNGMSISLMGVIDGNHFTVEIPEALKNSDLKLKVTDRKTNEIKEVSLPFTSDMKANDVNPYMEIEFDNIQNYSMQTSAIKNVFP